MAQHVHYDLDALARQVREIYAKNAPTNDFERMQHLGVEVFAQFAVFGARLDNNGHGEIDVFNAQVAVLAGLVANLAADFGGGNRRLIPDVLAAVVQYALCDVEVVAVAAPPTVKVGRA